MAAGPALKKKDAARFVALAGFWPPGRGFGYADFLALLWHAPVFLSHHAAAVKLGNAARPPLGVYEAIYGDARRAEEAKLDEDADMQMAAAAARLGR